MRGFSTSLFFQVFLAILALRAGWGPGLRASEPRKNNRSPILSFSAAPLVDATRATTPNQAPAPEPAGQPRGREEKKKKAATSTREKHPGGKAAETFENALLAQATPGQSNSTPSIRVSNFNIPESSIPKEELDLILEPLINRPFTLMELKGELRRLLQEAYAKRGILGVQVIVPPQTIRNKRLLVNVVEPRLGEVMLEGNRFFKDKVLLRYFKGRITGKGGVLLAKALERQLRRANRHPDRKITAILRRGKAAGTTDITFKVQERKPVHGIAPLHYAVTSSNTGTRSTGRQRITHTLQYTNLWGREHIIGAQWQFNPADFNTVQSVAASYQAPIGGTGHFINLYGGWSNVETDTSLEGIDLFGKSLSAGAQIYLELPEIKKVESRLAVGLEWNYLKNSLEFASVTALESELELLPLIGRYEFTERDSRGATSGYITLRYNIGGLVPKGGQDEFDVFRDGAPASFFSARLGLERYQRLPKGWGLDVNLEGQYSPDDLIPAEQRHLGGVDTVRGYERSEVSGDQAFLARIEVLAPPFSSPLGRHTSFKDHVQPAAFFDYGIAYLDDGFGGDDSKELAGAGAGLRYFFSEYFTGRVDCAWALRDGTETDPGDIFIHFLFQLRF